MPDEEIAHTLGRIEEQIKGLTQGQRDSRENIKTLFDKIDGIRADITTSMGRCPIHDARIKSLEKWRDGMWLRSIGLITLITGFLMGLGGLMWNYIKGGH